MDITELDGIAKGLFLKGLAESTQRAYGSGQRRFLSFGAAGGLVAVPAAETTLVYFVAQLAKDGLKYRTMKVYLSAVRYLHIMEGAADPFQKPLCRLQYTLQGVKRTEACSGTTARTRLPIGPEILRRMRAVLRSDRHNPDKIMLWAAVCLGYFGFLRAGEMTVPSDDNFDPTVHLTRGDIAVDDPLKPEVVRVHIKQSKTDPFRKGIYLYIGKTNSELCPVTALLGYLVVRGQRPGPLFVFKDGRFLSRQRLVSAVREALRAVGLDQSQYCGHSFRIGAATTAASRGLEDSVIKTLGRWRSLAYLDYVRIPREQLANYSRILAA